MEGMIITGYGTPRPTPCVFRAIVKEEKTKGKESMLTEIKITSRKGSASGGCLHVRRLLPFATFPLLSKVKFLLSKSVEWPWTAHGRI